MDNELSVLFKSFDECKSVSSKGVEFWMARDLQSALGYAEWRSFSSVIERAKTACERYGANVAHHFVKTNKVIKAGHGAEQTVADFFLSRYAAYLIAMNGDPAKPVIAAAQTYFAVQTRRQELLDQATDDEQRLLLRNRVKDANRKLAGAARQRGVQRWGIFQDAGYRGLYEMSLQDIKTAKGISEKENLLDRVGRMELAANEFRITQTEDKLARDGITTEALAIDAHRKIGMEVRATIKKIGGTMPETLKAEPPIKEIAKRVKGRLEAQKKALGSKRP